MDKNDAYSPNDISSLIDMEGFGVHTVHAKRNVVDTWMTIDSAPKDGTLILVANKNGVWMAKYKLIFQSGFRPDNPWQSMMLNHDHMKEHRSMFPSHWRPIPKSP